jgi:glycosyltransferase involved in cell wall biosynthesis
VPVVSISDAQRAPLPGAHWIGTVYHGLPRAAYTPGFEPGDYLAFLGRVSAEKRLDRAIEIARRAGLPLKIAAKIDPADREYYATAIRPLLGGEGVQFLGELGEGDKGTLLRGARAMLFPIDWPEPFGLAMIEAMAHGTPVVAWRGGSIDEVVDDGVTGFVVESIEDAVEAVGRTAALDRRGVRQRFEERFTSERMARDYLRLYRACARAERPMLRHLGSDAIA